MMAVCVSINDPKRLQSRSRHATHIICPPEPPIQRDSETAPTSGADEVAARQPGVMLAVAVATAEQRVDAEPILGRDAYQIQQSEGNLRNGDWIDFDPLATSEQSG
jgi:hypothetical protein